MYKTIIALLTVSLLTACQGENDNKVKFKAEIKGVEDDTEAIFYSTSEKNSLDPVDTVAVKNEMIQIDLPQVDEQKLIY